jgi:hypothetical protein
MDADRGADLLAARRRLPPRRAALTAGAAWGSLADAAVRTQRMARDLTDQDYRNLLEFRTSLRRFADLGARKLDLARHRSAAAARAAAQANLYGPPVSACAANTLMLV